MIVKFKEHSPKIDKSAFVPENVTVAGNVVIGADCGIWFGAVIRGDDHAVRVGDRTNVQDNSVVHCQEGHDTIIGDDCTIGHKAIIHGCKIGNRVLVGMGATIMNGAVIDDDVIIGAGALVTEGTKIPTRSLVVGFPAKVKRELTDAEVAIIRKSADHYVKVSKEYKKQLG